MAISKTIGKSREPLPVEQEKKLEKDKPSKKGQAPAIGAELGAIPSQASADKQGKEKDK